MTISRRLGLPLSHPAALIATWFGAGLLPWVPGTWTSLTALPLAWLIRLGGGPAALLAAVLAMFAIGCWAAAATARASGHADPRFIVIDEVAGQWLTLAAAPLDWRAYLAGFLLFRLFDITKPWPVSAVDRRIKGGFGIMLDDIVAAIYAALLLLIGGGLLGVRP